MRTHLDRNVIFFLVTLLVLAMGVSAFRYVNRVACQSPQVQIHASEYRVGELIRFKDRTPLSTRWSWDFGDSTEVDTEKDVYHTFDTPGTYQINLIVNGACDTTRELVILDKLPAVDTRKLPVFTLPKSITVGDTLHVIDSTANASHWEWGFGEHIGIDANTREASYSYSQPGLKTVSLIVNGDINHMTRKKIKVYPKEKRKEQIATIKQADKGIDWNIPIKPQSWEEIPEVPEEQPEEKPRVTTEEFTQLLTGVIAEENTSTDFEPHFCGLMDRKIAVNGRRMTMSKFCKKISGKRMKIHKVTLHYDVNNCISDALIKYKRTGLLNKIIHAATN